MFCEVRLLSDIHLPYPVVSLSAFMIGDVFHLIPSVCAYMSETLC